VPTVGQSGTAPRGSTVIALLVSGGPHHHIAARRYVESLPNSAALRVWSGPAADTRLRQSAKARSVRVRFTRDPALAVIGADIVFVFGRNPLTREQERSLLSHMIPVQHG